MNCKLVVLLIALAQAFGEDPPDNPKEATTLIPAPLETVRIKNQTDSTPYNGERCEPEAPSPKAEPVSSKQLLSIDWNEVGFSYFNGRVFKTGSAELKNVVNTRNTIASLLKIETTGLQGNAKLKISLRKPAGKGSVIVSNHSIPLCDLPALNRKALMLTLGLSHIALPAQCPVPSGIFKLSYYYNINGIDFIKGLPPGHYKIDFSIEEDSNSLLSFFWRVVIKGYKRGIPRKGGIKSGGIFKDKKGPGKVGRKGEKRRGKNRGVGKIDKPRKDGDDKGKKGGKKEFGKGEAWRRRNNKDWKKEDHKDGDRLIGR